MNPWMVDAVEVEKHLSTEGGRHELIENAGRNISEDIHAFNQLGHHTEAR
jgi:hypothetical protein